jgi:hypothetical protein
MQMLRVRAPLSPCVLVSLSCSLGFALVGSGFAQPDGGDKEYPKEVYFDFRGTPLAPELTVKPDGADRFVKSEPEGLRVTLPKNRKNLAPFELIARVGVQGDFEITATIEILHAETPRDGFGVGASLFINKVDPPTEAASVGRLLRPSGEEILFWDQGFGKPGEQLQFDFESRPCSDKHLRLRLKRTGSHLAYFFGAGLKGESFEALHPKNFGLNDIERVLLRVTTGRQPHSVDARLINLRIRSGHVPDPKDLQTVGAPAGGVRGPGSRMALVAALLLALSITLAVVFGLWFRRRAGEKTAHASAEDEQARAEAGATPVSFPCSVCGRRLKAKPALAGKKVKCTQCGNAVVVPGTQAGESAQNGNA